MPNATAVAQHLPFLRRYARAVTGTQTSGDAYVAAVLEAIVEDPKLLDTTDLRVTLYRNRTKRNLPWFTNNGLAVSARTEAWSLWRTCSLGMPC
jgi:response regulator PhyR-like protein